MKLIDKELRDQMIADDNLYVVYDTHDGDYYLVCSVITNHSMTIDEALDLCGIDMDEEADSEGWDGWDYDDLIFLSGAYAIKDLFGLEEA